MHPVINALHVELALYEPVLAVVGGDDHARRVDDREFNKDNLPVRFLPVPYPQSTKSISQQLGIDGIDVAQALVTSSCAMSRRFS